MADHMQAELVVNALKMAISRRRPPPGVIHHSDQGSQYVSLAFGQTAGDAGIARSMGSKGDCFDNAAAESFFATLKKELVHRHSWPTRRDSPARSSTTSRASTTERGDTPPRNALPSQLREDHKHEQQKLGKPVKPKPLHGNEGRPQCQRVRRRHSN